MFYGLHKYLHTGLHQITYILYTLYAYYTFLIFCSYCMCQFPASFDMDLYFCIPRRSVQVKDKLTQWNPVTIILNIQYVHSQLKDDVQWYYHKNKFLYYY